MNIITIRAWRRPSYLQQVLDALSDCDCLDQFDHVLVSVDLSSRQNECINVVRQSKLNDKISVKLHTPEKQLGCCGNARFVLEYAFNDNGAEFVVGLEDDTKPARDALKWLLDNKDEADQNDIFCLCLWRRAKLSSWFPQGHEDITPSTPEPTSDLDGIIEIDWFDPGGGWGITQKSWYEYIMSKGQMWGVREISEAGRIDMDLHGIDWVKETVPSDLGGFAWVWNKFNRIDKNHSCLYPEVSRSINIGFDDGMHPVKEVHGDNWARENWNDPDTFNWTGNEKLYL